ncbi:LacI family transcriptional regulator [Alkalihalobacillus oceani]|uniref:LacI family DNA-binding transcriptional regulator n=1 Tax=Halalkalibacter oceani TaxID=1653776 RepID=UPI002040817C|nr:LacI family DNA-binding transcriptional regulator [Halalkalibacter oceani]MCM3762145.1 LacI family transcriptional regulator [Halalkalibacter oceani]
MKVKTIKDVAKQAGVSISTVSRVLNGYKNVNPETHELVMDAVKRIGYSPNALARSLRSQSTRTLGLIVNNILNPIYSIMGQAIEDTARNYGYQVFLCNSGANPEYELQYLEGLYEKKVDGIIIAPTGQNKEKLELYVNSGIPVVQVDRYVAGLGTDAVLTDNAEGAYKLVSHMIKRGYDNIGIIVGVQTVTTGMERMTGYFNALAEHGFHPKSEYIKVGHFDEGTGYKAMLELLSLPVPPRAVFVGNNLMAKGAIKAIYEKGIRIPEDLAFGMYDDPDWAEMHNPPITVIRQPTKEIGVKATDILINRILNQSKENQEGLKSETVPSELIIRKST